MKRSNTTAFHAKSHKRSGSAASAAMFQGNGATEQQKKSVLNLVWNCLSPIARQKFVKDEVYASLLKNHYFEYFDLNNKVEFFGYQDEEN